jgi:serine/threonine-protein kinase
MVKSGADGNLVFAALAVQMDFVARDALAAAMAEWSPEGSGSLADLLVAKGALDPADRELLEAVVDRHLRRHGGDPGRSLSAPGSTRTEPDGICHQDFQLSPSPSSETPQLNGHADGQSNGHCEAGPAHLASGNWYRVLRQHAEGGLGMVAIAYDEGLQREVALKSIREPLADLPEYRARFLLEAEITGGLEHPSIVPVHTVGHFGNGRLFYTMRLIRGETLRAAIARFHEADRRPGRDPGERALALRKLLGQFVDACNAVAYAHSKGVLHRDLKPGNIMVGEYGEVQVVDWGMAKLVDDLGGPEPRFESDSGAGSRCTLVGTPDYTSPEQEEGRIDLIGPPSDVYSLGVTLVCLLTGHKPEIAKPGASRASRLTGYADAFPGLVTFRGPMPAPLAAVCVKALASRPEDRYASPRDLAAEVERWLAGEPVSAWPEPPPIRLARWARRHKPLVAGAAALLVSAVVGLSIGMALLRRANDRTEALRLQSEAHYQLARDAVDQFFTKVSEDRLLNEPHMERLRHELLATAQAFYQKLVDERKGDPKATAELGRAYLRLSHITAAIGSEKSALEQGNRALSIFSTLADDEPGVAAHRDGLAESHYTVAMLLESTGKAQEAERSFRRAIALREGLARDDPATASYRSGLAHDQRGLALLLLKQDRTGEAEPLLKSGVATLEQLVKDHPKSPAYRSSLSGGLNELGTLYRDLGRTADAEAAYTRAKAIQETLTRDHPDVAAYRDHLAKHLVNLGLVYKNTGRTSLAEQAYRQAAAAFERLGRDHPRVSAYRGCLAAVFESLGELSKDTARADAAESSFKEALRLHEGLARDHPDVLDHRADVAGTHNRLGVLYWDLHRVDDAEKSYLAAKDAWDALAREHPEVASYRSHLARIDNNLALISKGRGRKAGAEASYKRAVERLRALARENPKVVSHGYTLAACLNNLAELYGDSNRPAEAEAALKESVAVREALVRGHPELIALRLGLTNGLDGLGSVYMDTGRFDEAEETYRKALALRESLAKAHPEQVDFAVATGGSLCNLGLLLLESRGDLRSAIGWFDRAIETLEAAHAREPRHANGKAFLRNAFWGRAEANSRAGRHAEAFADLDRAVALDGGGSKQALQSVRCLLLARGGDLERATSETASLLGDNPSSETLVEAASIYAVASGAATRDNRLADADRARRSDAYAAKAQDLLTEAQAAGYFAAPTRAGKLREPEFEALRSRPEFRTLLRETAFPADPFAR